MSRVDQIALTINTNAWGGATVNPIPPINGYLVSVRMPNGGTAITNGGGVGGSADFSIVRRLDAGTVFVGVNVTAPFELYPARSLTYSTGGTTAYALGIGPVAQAGVPVDDYISVVVSGAQSSQAGTMYLSFDGRAV